MALRFLEIDETALFRETLAADTDTATTTTDTTETTPTTTSTDTTTTLNQGPIVGQPAPTTAAGDTTFQFTTTDALGNTQVLTDVFTPS